MEERSSWLPVGLESPRLQPDDRASQRGELNGGSKRSKPSAAADSRGPYDQQRPEWEPPKPVRAKPPPADAKPPRKRPQPAKPPQEGPPQQAKPPGEQKPPSRPVYRQRRSEVDAMGQDKHRQVVGQRYGVSRSRSLAYYGIALGIVVGGYFGIKAAVDGLDKAPAHDPDKAPWSKQGAPQEPLGGFETGTEGPTQFQ